MLFKPPVCVEIAPDLTTVRADEYSKVYATVESVEENLKNLSVVGLDPTTQT